jgi:hypothetical protein
MTGDGSTSTLVVSWNYLTGGFVSYHPRTEWVDVRYPVYGPPIEWSHIDTAVIHYTADDVVPDGSRPDVVAGYLRAIQKSYTINRGYSIGYLFAVDQHGGVWQLRGWEYKSAANAGHNDHTFPILMLTSGVDRASSAAVHAVQQLIADAQQVTHRTLSIIGHGDLHGAATACPGVGLRVQLKAGVFTPQPDDPQFEEDDMPLIFQWEGEPWDCIGAWDPATGTFPWRGCPDASKVLASGMAKRAAGPFPASSKDDPMYQRVG